LEKSDSYYFTEMDVKWRLYEIEKINNINRINIMKRIISACAKKINESLSNQKFLFGFLAAGFLVIIYNFIFFVARNSVNIPYWDQWGISDVISGHQRLLHILFYYNNEHRIGVGLIVARALAFFSNWDQITEIKFISFLIISSTAIILYLKYLISKKLEIFDIIIPLITLNIFQAENLTWGFQISFVFPLFFLSLWLLSIIKIRSITKRNLSLTFLSLLGSFSSFHGLFLSILTIGYITFDYYKENREDRKIFIATLFANILIFLTYFIGFRQSEQSAKLSFKTIDFIASAINNGFFYPEINFISYLLAVIVIAFSLFLVYRLFKSKPSRSEIVGDILIFFGLLFILSVLRGRSAGGVDQAAASRYVTFAMLIPLGLFFVFSGFKKGKIYNLILFIFIFSNIILFSGKPAEKAADLTANKQKVMDCYFAYMYKAEGNLSSCYKIFPLYPNEDYLDSRVEKVLHYKNPVDFNSLTKMGYYYNIKPKGVAMVSDISDFFENFQNISKNGAFFTSVNNDPYMTTTKSFDDIKGMTWKSNAKGNPKVYFLFENEEYSEKYSINIKPVDGEYIVNLNALRNALNKKIVSVRIDPTDQAEIFSISDFTIYK